MSGSNSWRCWSQVRVNCNGRTAKVGDWSMIEVPVTEKLGEMAAVRVRRATGCPSGTSDLDIRKILRNQTKGLCDCDCVLGLKVKSRGGQRAFVGCRRARGSSEEASKGGSLEGRRVGLGSFLSKSKGSWGATCREHRVRSLKGLGLGQDRRYNGPRALR